MINLDAIDLTDYELYRHGFPHELFTTLRQTAPVWRHPHTAGRSTLRFRTLVSTGFTPRSTERQAARAHQCV